MNRCNLNPSIVRLATVLTSGWLALCAPAHAQASAQGFATAGEVNTPVRQFPPAAKRGILEITQAPNVLVNGQAERLSPGARIRGTNNLLVMSNTLSGKRVVVNYLRELNGLVHQVWILTPQEQLEKRDGASAQNWVAGSDLDKPTYDDGSLAYPELPPVK